MTSDSPLGRSAGQPDSLPGEPGIAAGAPPPFAAEDEATRWLFSLNRFGIRPGLRRIRALLAELDHPERSDSTVVVAGTNGKGSTTRLLAGLLRGADYKVGCFTSPHLLRVYERITIDDAPCDPSTFAAKIARLRPLVEKHQASWFEALTALALEICREQRVDFLCCETGLGGRLDATNALPAVATLLTTVSLDHQHILGDTLAEIAAEKLGLLKEGAPLFCAVADELKLQVWQSAVAAGSPCYFLDEQVRWQREDPGWSLTSRRAVTEGLPLPNAPVLQSNMALAWLCSEELAAKGVWRLPADPAAALQAVFLPGRFQQVLSSPDWWVDTAHNDQALLAALAAFRKSPCRGSRLVLFGCMRDKALGAEVGALLRGMDAVAAAPIQLPRSRNLAELEALLQGWGMAEGDRRHLAADLGAAISWLAARLQTGDSVLVTGSCFLVAEVLHRLGWRDLEDTRQIRAAQPILAAFGDR